MISQSNFREPFTCPDPSQLPLCQATANDLADGLSVEASGDFGGAEFHHGAHGPDRRFVAVSLEVGDDIVDVASASRGSAQRGRYASMTSASAISAATRSASPTHSGRESRLAQLASVAEQSYIWPHSFFPREPDGFLGVVSGHVYLTTATERRLSLFGPTSSGTL